MSEIMSTPTDWSQFYQNLSNREIPCRVPAVSSESMLGAESTVVTTTIMSTSSGPISPVGSSPAAGSSGPGRGHLMSPEGRVGKPAARKRSRASRRTPTTLFNTDPTNFRAMVQQFTGGPSASFAAAGGGGRFSFGGLEPHVSPVGSLMVPPSGFHLQQQQNQLIQHHQNQPYMFSLNPIREPNMMEAAGVSSEVLPSGTTSSSSNGNRINNVSFMF